MMDGLVRNAAGSLIRRIDVIIVYVLPQLSHLRGEVVSSLGMRRGGLFCIFTRGITRQLYSTGDGRDQL